MISIKLRNIVNIKCDHTYSINPNINSVNITNIVFSKQTCPNPNRTKMYAEILIENACNAHN